MNEQEARNYMRAKAAELAAMVKARHVTYAGAENTIAAVAEGLAPDPTYRLAWNLYDYGIEQFRVFHSGTRESSGSTGTN